MRSPKPAFDLRAALAEEIRAALDELEHIAEKPKALHRCRLRLKRARALARVGFGCAPGLSEVFNDTARGVMRHLAPHRDVAALTQTALEIGKGADGKIAKAMAALAQKLEDRGAALAPLNVEATRAGLKDLLALAQVWPEASDRQIRRGAERIAKRAHRAHRNTKKHPGCESLHEWRKRETDRLYAASALGSAWPARRRRRLGAELTETLGRARDAHLLLLKLQTGPDADAEDQSVLRAERALSAELRRCSRRAAKLGARLHR